jgi:hypothetical protein
MTDYTRLSAVEAEALELFFRKRDRLADLNLLSATLRSTGKLISARLPFISADTAGGRTLRATLADRWNSARRLHRGVVSAANRTMRGLIRARRAAGLGD